MKLYATVATYADAPDTPELIAAWPARWIDGNPSPTDLDENGGPQSSLDMLRGDPATLAAAVIVIDVPDEQLAPLLKPLIPTVTGTVSAVD